MSQGLNEFQLAIITPEGTLYEKKAIDVNLPGSEGRFGVLAGHMNMVSSIKPGIVEVREKGSSNSHLFVVYDGIAEINAESCSVLVEKGAFPKDVTKDELQKLISQEKKALGKAETDVGRESAEKNIEYLESLLSLK